MKSYIILFAISMALALLALHLEAAENRKLRKELRAERVKNSQRWDWTKEGEKRAGQVMEMICDKCHEPFRGWSQDELDIACARCKLPEAVHRLAEGGPSQALRESEGTPSNARRYGALAQDDRSGEGMRGEEARG